MLVLEEDADRLYPRARVNQSGVSGDVEEMLAVFDACILVGKVERAELILTRLAKAVDGFPAEELILLHNRYLRASLDQVRMHPNIAQAEGLSRWYELHIRGKGLPQTAETIACMLKVTLLTERHPDRRRRLITRYMGMAPGEAGLHVLSMSEILNDQDLAAITQVCPTYNLAPAEEVEAAPEQAAENKPEVSASMADVLPTPQKGFGLKSLKRTLSMFEQFENCDTSTLPLRERREIQAQLERDCIDAAMHRWREENESLRKMGLNTSISHASLSSRLYDWQTALEARLKDEMGKIEVSEATPRKNQADYDRCAYGPFMRLSSPSRLAAVTILSILSSTAISGSDKGIPIASAITSLAKFIEEDIKMQHANQNAKPKPKKYQVVIDQSAPQTPAPKIKHGPLLPDTPASRSQLAESPWPISVKAKLGSVLLGAFMDTAKIKVVKENPVTKTLVSQYQPAFSHAIQLKRGRKLGMLLLNKELVNVLNREPAGDFLAKHLPMIVEPEPWQDFTKGAYLESRTGVVRIKHGDKEQRLYTEAAIARGDMEQVFKGLDVLGQTAWRVNTPVLNVMIEAWNTGKPIANLPALRPDIEVPPEPDVDADPTDRREWIHKVKKAENERQGAHSQRCFMNFQLEVARAFRNQTFYFPHNVDFRGRAYPLPTYLNHMGADHVRGLLRFARGKELGEQGLQWLKIHLANVYGFDKASLKDRAAFAMDNLTDVFDSANNPLNGKQWWLKAEDPWQCLATCYELKAALESPDPTKYVSHLPVHQDGTCNGLQHYAALGGDTWGAQQVNLAPSDKPADVYTAVADIVKQSISDDAAAGNPQAQALDGKITRKVVKQTVMTNVYGVTFTGAKKQICKQLDALYPNLHTESGFTNMANAGYIASLVFKGLSSMFQGAHDIQYFLGEIGGRVCKALSAEQLERIANDGLLIETDPATGKKRERKVTQKDILSMFRATIVWTTPLRMPIAQPYRKNGTRIIKTSLQDLSFTVPDRSDPVNAKKQLQAFPPNFIHSLDATHMLLSALECKSQGLDFAAVHDSFWTHAADVDSMNIVLRDAFIRVHEEDVVARLLTEFEARYRGSLYLATVDSTTFTKKVQKWRQETTKNFKTELMMEYERQKLLCSSDPEDVARGKEMTTPYSMYEEMNMSHDVVVTQTKDLEGFGLGEISEKEHSVDEDGAEDAVVESSAADENAHSSDEAAPSGDEDVHASDDSNHKKTSADRAKIGAAYFQSMKDNGDVSNFECRIVAAPKRRNLKPGTQCNIWMPLTFPALPKKGDFNVQQLKESKYFFS
ncbi:putative DNA-dependent RNA polymerase [Colletotrichum karsti]|uniref:DNA-directed RNA polymerase n=1 Tax=Colletotrichum karsti TaxID=1095194 RepID=A0A9P6LGB4_9PEZI|nr:putative DNA-dependent RNA polymerase [Colletotrichum karsti]KAF9872353.1 putative DNA-dependent RNA polymerase [Colletotrichum karsti]